MLKTWILLTLTLVVCSAVTAAAQTLQPAGWDAGITLPEASDLNADPHTVEINLAGRGVIGRTRAGREE